MNIPITQGVTIPNESTSSESTSFLLSKIGLIALLVILLIAAWNGQIFIVILLGLAISAAMLGKLWSRLSLRGVGCGRTVSEDRVFAGETVELKVRLVNRKVLPLPWVQLSHMVPDQLEIQDAIPESGRSNGRRILGYNTSLFWYSAISWHHTLLCRKRGYYDLGNLTVTSGDIFGLYPRSRTHTSDDTIIVYPRIFPIEQFGLPSTNPLGETQAERRIFEDQTRTIGVREYTPHDSLRYIHWKASARHQNLQVKVFEPTTTLKIALFIAVDSFQSGDENDFELGISAAASLANYIIQKRSQVGLFANTRSAVLNESIQMAPAGSNAQLVGILEALAKVTTQPSGDFEEFFQDVYGTLPWGTTCVFIIDEPLTAFSALLSRLKGVGFKSVVLQIGKRRRNDSGLAAAWHTLKPPEGFTDYTLENTV
ncbi:MAG: DUF58 domain-containing protein [Dehalococcoidales bacterium]